MAGFVDFVDRRKERVIVLEPALNVRQMPRLLPFVRHLPDVIREATAE